MLPQAKAIIFQWVTSLIVISIQKKAFADTQIQSGVQCKIRQSKRVEVLACVWALVGTRSAESEIVRGLFLSRERDGVCVRRLPMMKETRQMAAQKMNTWLVWSVVAAAGLCW